MFLIAMTVLRSTGQGFCRWFLKWNLSNISLIIILELCVSEEGKEDKVLFVSHHKIHAINQTCYCWWWLWWRGFGNIHQVPPLLSYSHTSPYIFLTVFLEDTHYTQCKLISGILWHSRFVSSPPSPIYWFDDLFLLLWIHGHMFNTFDYNTAIFYFIAKNVLLLVIANFSHWPLFPFDMLLCVCVCVCVCVYGLLLIYFKLISFIFKSVLGLQKNIAESISTTT